VLACPTPRHELLREQDAGDVVVCVGGTIPAQDIPEHIQSTAVVPS
jgi:methylmalonyl-CoA mutase cobalamin-binding subunit